MTRGVNEAAQQITMAAEDLRLTAYVCPAGKITIGWGHTGPDVRPNMTIDEERAKVLLQQDLASASAAVEHYVTASLGDNAFGALVDFTFNLGGGALANSTLLKLLNAGDVAGAADQLLRWDKAHVDGQLVELPGLKLRRQKERLLFLTPDGETPDYSTLAHKDLT